jgi:hypothetical protein
LVAFTDRMIATLVVLRFQLPHAAVAVLYDVARSTVTRAAHEIRPLMATRGFAVPMEDEPCLHTMADVFAYASAQGVEPRVDGTEVRNTKKVTVVTDGQGRALWTGAMR